MYYLCSEFKKHHYHDKSKNNSKKTRKDFADYFAITYPTISACKADNEVLVLDFEEPQPQQQRELHVTISVTPDMLPKIVSIGAVVVK